MKTYHQLLKEQQMKYNRLHTALSVVPDGLPVTSTGIFTTSVDLHLENMTEAEYHKWTEQLTDYELYSYSYVGKDYNKPHLKKIRVCHKLELVKGEWPDYYSVEIYFTVVTRGYKKFLDFISGGNCQIKTEWVIPDNKPYETVSLSCGG